MSAGKCNLKTFLETVSAAATISAVCRQGVDSDAGLGNGKLTESAALFAGTSVNRGSVYKN